jgi:hypothetical protein
LSVPRRRITSVELIGAGITSSFCITVESVSERGGNCV